MENPAVSSDSYACQTLSALFSRFTSLLSTESFDEKLREIATIRGEGHELEVGGEILSGLQLSKVADDGSLLVSRKTRSSVLTEKNKVRNSNLLVKEGRIGQGKS